MGIFDFFKSDDKRIKLSHLKKLVALMLADGKIEKQELAAIAAVCSREGLTDTDLKRCLESPESIDFVPPANNMQRVQYLKDMVLLMMSDGNIDDNEMLVCKMTAEVLGFKHEVIDAMILDIIADLRKELGI